MSTPLTEKYRLEPEQQYDLALVLASPAEAHRVLLGISAERLAEIIERYVQEWRGTMWLEYYLLPPVNEFEEEEEVVAVANLDQEIDSTEARNELIEPLPSNAIFRDSFIRFSNIVDLWFSPSKEVHESHVTLNFLQVDNVKPDCEKIPLPASYLNSNAGGQND